jgi:Tol biopolymer transport system component
LARGDSSRFTFGPGSNQYPIWSPDGTHIAFTSTRDGGFNIYQKATSGPASEEALHKDSRFKGPNDWSRDGRFIIEETFGDPETNSDVWVLPLFGDRTPFPYVQTKFNEPNSKLSPNGRWLAYTSDEGKRYEIYVQTFPSPGGKWLVSTSGGAHPVWSKDGKELFYIGADHKMMATEVKGGDSFKAGVPKPLFDTHLASSGRFDVSKDGRFLLPARVEQAGPLSLTVVVNWTAGLKR